MESQTEPLQSIPPSQPPPIESNYSPEKQKPIWQTDAFIVLVLVLFWPVGLFLMWKYALWRKWVKGCLTTLFLIGALPILIIWSIVFGLKGLVFVQDVYDSLPFVKKLETYSCYNLNEQWNQCRNLKYNATFEYPSHWSYVLLRPNGIGFSDGPTTSKESYSIAFSSPHEYDLERAKQILPTLTGNKVTTVNGMWAIRQEPQTYDIIGPKVSVVHDNVMYDFEVWKERLEKRNYSSQELKVFNEIFEHMVHSFRIGQ